MNTANDQFNPDTATLNGLISLYRRHQRLLANLNEQIDQSHPADDNVWSLKTSKLYHSKMASELKLLIQKKYSDTQIYTVQSGDNVIDIYQVDELSYRKFARQIMDKMKLILTTQVVPLYVRNLLIKHRISLYNLYFRNSMLTTGGARIKRLPVHPQAS